MERLLGELRILKGRIGLLGLACKPHTDDLRDAAAIDIAGRLLDRGARVRLHDPIAMERFRVEQPGLANCCCALAEAVADECDALVLVTEWPQYLEMDWRRLAPRMRTPIVLDGRCALDPARLTRAGFRYLALSGWTSSASTASSR